MKRVGLVLGAGGVVGQVYHAGVLAALADEVGWDPRTAEVIVGTSAGSISATLVRTGVPARDLAAWALKAPLSAEGEVLERYFGSDPVEFEPLRASDLVQGRPSLPTRHMVRRAAVRPWHFRPLAAALALMAPGATNIGDQVPLIRELQGVPWPEEPLWICSVRRSDGRRFVFGRPGTPAVPLNLAVASSCSIPGYFAPVRIGEHRYVDGGAHSPTNAAVVRDLGLDLVIIVAPMAGPGGGALKNVYEASRWHAGRRLDREAAAIRNEGTRVIVFRPGEDEQRVMGDDYMSGAHVADIVRETDRVTRAVVNRPENRNALETLSASA